MATVKEGFSPAGSTTALTCTLNSLASSGTAGRESTVVDNSSNLFVDALVSMTIAVPNSAPANDKCVYLYAYGSMDGSVYPEDITGSDAAYTFKGAAGALTTSLRPIGSVPFVQNDGFTSEPFSVAAAFGGILPYKWGIAVLNYSGQTLSASGNSLQYVGIAPTVA